MSDHGPRALIRAYERHRRSGDAMVLATVIRARGSTYRSPGARMLIPESGAATGIVGGGCFDSDLMEQARGVFESGCPQRLVYDMRAPDEAIWGLGLGCEGEVTLYLQRLDGPEGNPIACLRRLYEADRGGRIVTLLDPHESWLGGHSWLDGEAPAFARVPEADSGLIRTPEGATLFIDRFTPPARLLICGAGVDAVPLTRLALGLGWRVTVLDHRPGHVRPDRFPEGTKLVAFDGALPPDTEADAAVVMSHHLEADRAYLAALAETSVGYLGVLGPTARRQRLLEELGETAGLAGRLRGPVGLDLGGELPEEIALSAIAEIQAVLNARAAKPLTAR